ncbi:MAG: hypothetical protein OJF49_000849 [Ktedonobacterales bacterium]|nr:MAG: hypothetical protein OJF49_000849 [Ktedonobacterales bacterium]
MGGGGRRTVYAKLVGIVYAGFRHSIFDYNTGAVRALSCFWG